MQLIDGETVIRAEATQGFGIQIDVSTPFGGLGFPLMAREARELVAMLNRAIHIEESSNAISD
jgi:hypothetical protein